MINDERKACLKAHKLFHNGSKQAGLQKLKELAELQISLAALMLYQIYNGGINHGPIYDLFHDYGDNTEKDKEEAETYFQQALKLKNPRALLVSARREFDSGNFKGAHSYSFEAIESPDYFNLDSITSMSFISSIYGFGLGVEQRIEHALLVSFVKLEWYRRNDIKSVNGGLGEYFFYPSKFSLPTSIINLAKNEADLYFYKLDHVGRKMEIAVPNSNFDDYYEKYQILHSKH